MKKVLTVIMSLMLVFTLAFSTACSIGIFGGKYTEVSADELTTFANDVDSAEFGDEINYASGVKISMDMKAKVEEDGETGKIKMSMDVKAIEKDGELKMSGELKTKIKEDGEKETIKAEYYYTDGTMYMSYETDDEEQKMKVPMNIDDVVESLIQEGDFDPEFSLLDVVEEYGDIDVSVGGVNAKFSTCEKGDKTKVKFELEMEEGNLTMIWVYNEDNALIAYQMTYELSYDGYEVEAEITVKPWDGKVKLPKDLDTY